MYIYIYIYIYVYIYIYIYICIHTLKDLLTSIDDFYLVRTIQIGAVDGECVLAPVNASTKVVHCHSNNISWNSNSAQSNSSSCQVTKHITNIQSPNSS